MRERKRKESCFNFSSMCGIKYKYIYTYMYICYGSSKEKKKHTRAHIDDADDD